jgi:hypothetical protein
LTAIEKVVSELELAIEKNNDDVNDRSMRSIELELTRDDDDDEEEENPKEESEEDEGTTSLSGGALRRRLLAARVAVKARIAEAISEFGEELVNRQDLEELRVVEDQLFAMACRGAALVPPPPAPSSALRPRLAVATEEVKKLKSRLKRLEEEKVFLNRVFEKAYEAEEGDEEVEDSSDSDDDDEDYNDGSGTSRSLRSLSGCSVSPSSSRPGTGTSDNDLGFSSSSSTHGRGSGVSCGGGGGGGGRKKRSRLTVPSVSVMEASRFFLLSHMLSHLEGAEGYDIHGKTFYDLTGSGGQVGLLLFLVNFGQKEDFCC